MSKEVLDTTYEARPVWQGLSSIASDNKVCKGHHLMPGYHWTPAEAMACPDVVRCMEINPTLATSDKWVVVAFDHYPMTRRIRALNEREQSDPHHSGRRKQSACN